MGRCPRCKKFRTLLYSEFQSTNAEVFCGDCYTLLVNRSAPKSIRLVTEDQASRIKPPKEVKTKPKLSVPKAKSNKVSIKSQILSLLKIVVLSCDETFELLKDKTTRRTVEHYLTVMSGSKIIISQRIGAHGKKYYTMPENKHLISEKLDAYFIDDVLPVLGDRCILVSQLAQEMSRPLKTVLHWLEQLKKQQKIVLKIKGIPGKKGVYKFVEKVISITHAFEVDKRYQCKLIGDHELILSYRVLKISPKGFVTLRSSTGDRRTKIFVDKQGVQFCYPQGQYSLCPILKADNAQEPNG
jgi:hypothetical protein